MPVTVGVPVLVTVRELLPVAVSVTEDVVLLVGLTLGVGDALICVVTKLK